MAKSLHDGIIEYGKILSTEFIASITKELLLAIQYSHSKDIVHLNLNLKNILILSQNIKNICKTINIVDPNGNEEKD